MLHLKVQKCMLRVSMLYSAQNQQHGAKVSAALDHLWWRAGWSRYFPCSSDFSVREACRLLENCLLGCFSMTTRWNIYMYTMNYLQNKNIKLLFLHICETLLHISSESRQKIVLKRTAEQTNTCFLHLVACVAVLVTHFRVKTFS